MPRSSGFFSLSVYMHESTSSHQEFPKMLSPIILHHLSTTKSTIPSSPGPCMRAPAVLVNPRFHCFLSYPFRSSRTNRTRQTEACRGDPHRIPAFASVLASPSPHHAIMHTEITPPFQPHRHVHNLFCFHQKSLTCLQNNCVPGAPPDRPLEAKWS